MYNNDSWFYFFKFSRFWDFSWLYQKSMYSTDQTGMNIYWISIYTRISYSNKYIGNLATSTFINRGFVTMFSIRNLVPVDFLFLRKSDRFDPGGIFISTRKFKDGLLDLSYEIICHRESSAKTRHHPAYLNRLTGI